MVDPDGNVHAGELVAGADIVAAITEEGGTAIALTADVTDEDSVITAVAAATEALGTPAILHNNVGVTVLGGVDSLSREAWDRGLALNVSGVFLTCKHTLPAMLEAGRSRRDRGLRRRRAVRRRPARPRRGDRPPQLPHLDTDQGHPGGRPRVDVHGELQAARGFRREAAGRPRDAGLAGPPAPASTSPRWSSGATSAT
ncbi:SDR family NAD(P)-dependent oxidoreductase [Pseudonocardia sp. McavD-2-B]|uniref:SDR family NAD(P)-dependent oxidoreductase n=1 Tax=Pseudonocardia sp. McavD-2-B TaxID=2954499 RepID=UPI002096F985|nr:SDR family NAD(P)-dependent oxidoreductase [Pseudonocardia sp. McavD-2-B]MCO7191457.1 SDR family NAD(P)-dependent oxidoreductase [Pseudonocardia sp. McavD-2-B]